MTQDILAELASAASARVEEYKRTVSSEEMADRASALPRGDFPFEKALKGKDIGFICECKKASPSKGLIAPDFPYVDIAREYEAAGASCISVLTEPTRFLGEDRYLSEISRAVKIPCLRKDFTVDDYMIYQAKTLGASAVLLICSLLNDEQLEEYVRTADGLGLSVLCEAHDAEEVDRAVASGARVIGVNNRNLRDFTVDIGNCIRLRDRVPDRLVYVAESGIRTSDDVSRLRDAGVDAVLVGEALMRATDKRKALDGLRGSQ